jgi:hypothetical protein
VRNVVTDLAFAVRLLRRDRLFAVAAVSILAVGLGAAVAVLSIADVVFFRPVPHPNPEGLFEIVEHGGHG